MLYTRNKPKKPQPNWPRIVVAILVVVLLGASIYFIVAGVQNASVPGESDAPPSLPASGQDPSPDATPDGQAQTPDASPETPTPTPATTPDPGLTGKRAVTIGAVGEIGFNSAMLNAGRADGGYDFAEMLDRVLPYIGSFDHLLGALDCSVADEGEFGDDFAPGAFAKSLGEAGFSALSLAGDHALDRGTAGFAQSLSSVEAAGVQALGSHVWVKESADIKIGFVGYTASTIKEEAGSALAYLTDENVERDIAALKDDEQADFVVAMVNWGEAGNKEITQEQKDWAKKLADAGVDAIIGSGPHYLQELTSLRAADGRDVLVAYSLGNFLHYQRAEGREMGAILGFTVEKDYDAGTVSLVNVQYVPTWTLRYSFQGKYHFEVMQAAEYAQKNYQNMNPESKTRIKQVPEQVKAALGEDLGKMNDSVIEPAND